MGPTEDEFRLTMHKLLGEKLKAQSIEKQILNCEINGETASQFLSLVRILIENICEDLEILYFIIRVGLKFLDAKLIDDSFWFSLMVCKKIPFVSRYLFDTNILQEINYTPSLRVDKGCHLLYFLLEQGLLVNSRDAWKCLALLLEIIYDAPRSKKTVIEMLREKFALKVGFLLDHLTDFQQGNYLVELLSNCFPRKHIEKPGAVLPPLLWDQRQEKNEAFFGSLDYPFRGKHADMQVTAFVLKMFGAQLENVVQVENISYGSSNENVDSGKRFRPLKQDMERGFCYIQAIHDGIYLYDGESLFLQLDRRHVRIVKTMKGCIRMKIATSSCIRSPNKMWANLFTKAKWFHFQLESIAACERVFQSITSYRKVSEVSTFLALNHIDEGLPQDAEPTKLPDQDAACKPQGAKNHLETPENSDAKIQTDEWDINLSSEFQGTTILREDAGHAWKGQLTPKNIDKKSPSLAAGSPKHNEESPLVLAQKRRRIRETNRTLELLRKELAQEDDCDASAIAETGKPNLERSPSLMITKSGNIADKRTGEQEKVAGQNGCVKTANEKGAKSIGRRDINVLDTIFSTPNSHKRVKRQRELKNYKPLVEVPSQEGPKVQTRNQRRKHRQQQQKALAKSAYHVVQEPENFEGDKRKHQLNVGEERKLTIQKNEGRDIKPLLNESLKKLPSTEHARREEVPFTKPLVSAESAAAPPPHVGANSPNENSNSSLDSTTIVDPLFNSIPNGFETSNAFTEKLQEQIFSSITVFSNELVRKMTIINKELNNKIVRELSEKYQNLFLELQKNFQSDTEEMFRFVGEIKEMLNLPEDKLVQTIRSRKFGYKPSI
ncbi:RED1 (YLR263W) [Zygosaccharomyces parabailii]|nr:RED1 (YLR263W) [Zygosaccharomyces parabailii]CDH15826.1 uncharacterized protein ZBAI_07613 [Zygosaccharomyces bailii ISA1307]